MASGKQLLTIDFIIQYCNETEMYLVNEACLDLVTNSTIYLPKLSPSLTAHLPNTTLLDELLKTVTEVVGVANSSVIADRQVVYDQFLNEVVSLLCYVKYLSLKFLQYLVYIGAQCFRVHVVNIRRFLTAS